MPKSQEQCKQMREDMRNRILKESSLYFAKNGFGDTKIGDLAKSIGIGQGTIYLYFESKEELFEQIRKSADNEEEIKKLKVLSKLPLPAMMDGDLVLYPNTYEVEVAGEPVQLTRRAYDLLEFLMRNKRTVLTRDQILEQVWGYDYTGDTNVVDVYIRYLRAKLDDRFQKKYIYTVRGVGYVIRD